MELDLKNVIHLFERDVGPVQVRSLMAKLAENASSQGHWMADRRYHLRRRGGDISTDPRWRPGAFIEKLPPEQRAVLKELRSSDIRNLAPSNPFVLESPLRASERSWSDDAKPTTWKLPGTNPDRS